MIGTLRLLCKKTLGLFALLLVSQYSFSQQLAFPGAEGFGRFATGGRGGEVYHVTNLNDSGVGSFRDAVSKSNRIVVFDVGGIINITDRIVIQRNIYVAGQTAPGDGIMLYGNGVALNSSSGNSIVRYIRIRMGQNGDSRKDALGISDGQDYIFDNVSISWGHDGTVDVNGSNIDNITFQDCIIGQGIDIVGHSTGGLMQSGKWSVIRSIYVDNETRNPKGKGTHEVMNCIMYNWGSNGYIMGSTSGLSEVNAVGNNFVYGPSSSSNSHITGTTPSFNVYGADNWIDSDKNGAFNPYLMTDYKTATLVNTPFPYDGMNNVMPANEAFEYVLANAGSSLPHDAVDKFLIDEIRSYGTKGRIIDRESDNGIPGNVGTLVGGVAPLDTDRDGMPDAWESERGLNPNVADNNGDDDGDGYTNIEEYLSCLVGEGDACTFNPKIDCHGDINGDAYLDECEVCVGGNTGISPCYKDCNGVVDGTAVFDQCGVCSGGNTQVETCAGTIQCESFCAADGILEASNLGFLGDGYLNLVNANGSEATWYVYSESNQSVDFGVRIANGVETARGMNVLVNDIQATTVLGHSTGAWSTWSNEQITLNLIEGVNKITFSSSTSDGGPNLDLISFHNTTISVSSCEADCNGDIGGIAFYDDCDNCVGGNTNAIECVKDCNGDVNGNAVLDNCGVCTKGNSPFLPCSLTIEGENACTVIGILSENKNEGFNGAGYVNIENTLESSASWIVNSDKDQLATISFRYANGGETNRDGVINLNNLTQTVYMPTTTVWNTWVTTSVNVNLSKGSNEIILESNSIDGLGNIDQVYISEGVTDANCEVITAINEIDESALKLFPNPTSSSVSLETLKDYVLYNNLGIQLDQSRSDKIDLSNLPAGVYFAHIEGLVYRIIKE